MSKGFIRSIAIVVAAGLAFALAGGPGATGSGKATQERSASQVQSRVQTQTQTQAQTRIQDPCACTGQQLGTQARVQEQAMAGSISCVDGTGPTALQSSLQGKGDVQRARDQARDQLRDGSCQLTEALSTFEYLIEYDNAYDYDYDHLYGYDHEPAFHYLHDGPPPEGGYGGHGA